MTGCYFYRIQHDDTIYTIYIKDYIKRKRYISFVTEFLRVKNLFGNLQKTNNILRIRNTETDEMVSVRIYKYKNYGTYKQNFYKYKVIVIDPVNMKKYKTYI